MSNVIATATTTSCHPNCHKYRTRASKQIPPNASKTRNSLAMALVIASKLASSRAGGSRLGWGISIG
jgi:hypothetical protein